MQRAHSSSSTILSLSKRIYVKIQNPIEKAKLINNTCSNQETMTGSEQKPYIPVTAFCTNRFIAFDIRGAFLLSELAGQTRQVAKKMQQFEGKLAS